MYLKTLLFSRLHSFYYGHRYLNTSFSVTRPHRVFFFFFFLVLIIGHQKVLFCHYNILFMKNWKTIQCNLSKNIYFSFFACFIFDYLKTPSCMEGVLKWYLLLKHTSVQINYTTSPLFTPWKNQKIIAVEFVPFYVLIFIILCMYEKRFVDHYLQNVCSVNHYYSHFKLMHNE